MAVMLPWLAAPLAQALRRQRGHALLVHGPAGVGQFEFTLELARAWLCETPAAQRPDGLACGGCGSCHMVDSRTHTDLRLVVPEALREAAGLPVDDNASDDGDKKRKPSREIKVEQVRAALEFSERTSGRGMLKVVLLHPAESLNHIAANTLLKTLEEPPGPLRFILSCGAAHELLPTVRSRCQDVALAAPARDVALAWLAEQGVDDAATLLDACGGQPLLALERHQAGLGAAAWAQVPQWVAQGQSAPLMQWPLPAVIEALQKLAHDQLLAGVGAPPRYFRQGVSAGADLAALTAWCAELRRHARHAEHPLNAGLAIEALVQKAQFAGRRPAPRAARVAGPRLHSNE
jgi:DNA polymerase III subunit delta'